MPIALAVTARLPETTGGSGDIMAAIPEFVSQCIVEFLLDRKTGNIQLNVKDGQILGLHLNEIVQRPTD
jgi:hypothetical protein